MRVKQINLRKLWLSLLLLVGATAIAIPGIQEVAADGDVAKIGEQGYETLQEAFNKAADGQTVTLLRDYDATGEAMAGGTRQFVIKKNITFDGGGFTLTTKQKGVGIGNVNSDISSNIDVTIKNITIKNTSSDARCIDTRGNIGSLTLDGVTLNTQGASGTTQPLTIGGNQSETATVNITNSTIQTNNDGTAYYAITTFNPVNMTISNSTLKGWACIYAKGENSSAGSAGSVFTVKDNSTLVSKNAYSGETNGFSAIMIEDNNVTVNIENTELNLYNTGDQVQSVAGYSSTTYSTTGGVSLGEGTVLNVENTGTGSIEIATNDVAVVGGNSGVIVSGGTYDIPIPDKNCAEGYIPTDLGNGKYGVKEGTYVAEIVGGAKYESLQAAINAAAEGNTVTLLTDINMGATAVNIDKGITIDGDSHTITSTANAAVEVSGTGNVTISNTKINATNGRGIQVGNVAHYSGQLTINEGSVITVAKRGINILDVDQGFALNVDGSIIQTNVADPTTTYTTGEDSRGINFSNDPLAFTANITDSEIRGFSYCTNIYSGTENLTLNISGGKTYGRDVVNNWGKNNTFNLDGVEVHGLNNQTGPTEAFACIVENTGSANNNYNINDCQFIATLSDAAINTANSSASEYMIDLRGNNTKVVITGNTSYTTNASEKGGFIENEPYIDNNTIMMDETAANTFANAFEEYKVVETEEAPGYTVNKKDYVAQINNVKYESLAKAVKAAQANDVITMIADDNISLTTAGSEITIDKPLTITGAVDESGVPLFTIYGSSNGSLNNNSFNDLFLSCSTGTVTISNVKFDGFGNETTSVMGHSPVFIGSSNSNAVIENVYINKLNCEGIHINGGTFTIKDCNIDCSKTTNSIFTKGICVVNAATGSIENTTITGVDCNDPNDTSAAIELQGSGNIAITGCTIQTKTIGIAATPVGELTAGTSQVTISDCTINSHNIAIFSDGEKGALTSIQSGQYSGLLMAGDNDEGLSISGGIFGDEPALAYCAEGFIPTNNTDESTSDTYPYTVKEGSYVAEIDGDLYETLADAFSAAADGNTVTLLKDVSLTDRLFVNAGAEPAYAGSNNRYATTLENKSITLDLSGYNVTTGSNIALAGGSLNIVNSGIADAEHGVISTSGSGLAPIEVRGTGDLASKRTLTIGDNVTLKGGEYGLNIFGSNDEQKNVIEVNVNGKVEGELFVLGNLKNAENDIVINVNGTVDASNAGGDDPKTAISLNGNAKVIVGENAKVTGETGIEVRAGELTVNGGTITGTASEYSYAPNGSGTTVKGAAIAVAQHNTVLPVTATVNGGTLEGTKTIAVVDVNNNQLDKVTVTAKDEFVTNNAEIPAGFKWVSSEGMSTLTPCDYVAQVGETKYETLADAFSAAADGNTVTLLKDVALTDRLFVNAGAAPAFAGSNNRYATTSENKSITLELNGYNVTTGSNIALAGGSLNIVNSGTADADHGVISTSGSGLAPIEIRGTGDLTQKRTLTIGENVTLKGADYGLNVFGSNDEQKNAIEVNVNGKVEGTLFVLGNLKNTENDIVVNVNGSVTKATDAGISLNGLATVNVAENATVEGDKLGIEVRAGNLNVAGGTITSKAEAYTVNSNGSGSAATGAAISVAQHTTGLPILANINGGTLTGVKTISVADPENKNLEGVTVKVADALANAETVIIPEGYKWVSDGSMSTLTEMPDVAQIGDVKYKTLEAAFAAAAANGTEATTITLLADVTENVSVGDGKNIVLDLGEKTLTGYIDQYDSELNVKNGNVAGTVYVNGGPASAEAGYNKFTLANNATISADYGIILYQAEGTTVGYGSTIDINGTVNGMVWVMGNITKGNSIINVNSGASIKGDVGVALNGLATVNVAANTTIEGAEVGIEARAGNLNVEGGTITSTATAYSVKSEGSGTTTTGAAIAVAQHTTGLPINANILGGTLSGVKTISVADPQGLNYAGVVVTAKDELTVIENNVIPEGYIWESNDDGTSTLKTKEDAGIYDLFDSTIPDKYKAYEDYGVTGNKNVKSVTYTRMFATSDVPYYRPWYIPFDYKITEADTENFVFFRISMIAGSETSGEVDPTTTNNIVLYIKRMEAGEVLKANRPYILKPIVATGEYVFKAENTTLYAPDYTSRKHVETSEFKYDFYGNYVKDYPCGPDYSMYYLGSRNAFSPNRSTSKLQSYRWYVKVESNDINADAKPVFEFVEEDGEATGINNTNAESADEIEGIYNSNGIRLESKTKGLNIIKYKSGKTKKIYIK